LREKVMRINGHGFLVSLYARHRIFLSVGSALIISTLLCTAVVNRAKAASSGPTGVNRTVPKVSSLTELKFSSPPTDAQFLYTGLFAEPLAPVAATTAEENRDLAQALLTYRDAIRESGAADAVEALLAFLTANPASPWKPALQLNLGMIYRQTGHFSKALEIWQAGWSDAQSLSDPHGRALANAIVARLSQLEAYLGRKELLQPLLDSIDGRPVGGTAAQLITDSHTGLYHMLYMPGESFRCGPLALTRILKYRDAHPSPAALRVLAQAPSTDHGLSLAMVHEIATRAGMEYQMAFRTPGAATILPAVAHWKVGHYAALVDRVDGRYVVQDTTFGDDIRVSPSTLDEEASGYFLVPLGALPPGWRHVSADEGTTVWGRGDTGANHDPGATGPSGSNSKCSSGGCTTSSVELEVVGLQLHDMPVGYTPSLGPPVTFDLYYSHRDTQQPTTFSYTNFGPKWTFTWLSYVTDTVNSSALASVYLRGGGSEPFTFSSTSATTAYAGPYSQTVLARTVNSGGASTGFTLTFPDGSYEQFDQALGNQFFMTAVSDAAGNIVTLTYDSQMRISAITDAIGQVTTLSYGLSGSPLLVTQITDPFGRSASFSYNASGLLASITDVLGIVSSYSYGQGTDPDFINTLTTPYGSTTFTYGDSSTNSTLGNTRFLITTDPLGRKSYVEYSTLAFPGDVGSYGYGGGVNPAFVPSGIVNCNQLQGIRNTFVFDANQYAAATAGGGGLNYSLGKAIHWLRSPGGAWATRVKESEKEPLENRIWYNYPAEVNGGLCDGDASEFAVLSTGVVTNGASNQPSAIGRVLDSGATQLQTFQYNSSGNVTQATDAAGRQWTYTYAANGMDRLTTSNTTSGTQLLETRTYNGLHLPLTITGTNGRTDHFAYNAAGQLTRHTDALGHVTSLSYDSSGHLKSITGPISSAKYSFAYDSVSRIASVTDPAGAIVHYTYDAADRPLKSTYPDGTTSVLAYTLLDLTSSTDRLSQKTRYSYDADRELISTTDPFGNITRQGYNLAGKLDSITDANNHTTTFVLDDQSRVTAKQFANGTATNIAYENALSRIATITDALSQTTDYTYNIDNSTATVSYSANQATPNVSFAYDPSYPRPTSMTDGVGTTIYTYYPVSSSPALGANQLQSVNSPIAGTSGTDTIAYTYDALNRVIETTVNGAAQSIGFDALGRVTSASNPLDSFTYSYSDGTSRIIGVSSNSGPTAALSYFGPTGDELLQQLNYTTHSGSTSLAQFGYTYNADDNVKSLTISSPSAQTSTYAYDTANRLLSSTVSGSTQNAYGYDHASNLASITAGGSTQSFSYTSTNAITAATYDPNGSPTVLSANTYKWDGANRVAHFANSAANTASSFSYDGLGRLVRIVDTHGGAITADHSYTWCGNVRCLAHDNTQSGSPVSTQYFDQGAIIGGTPYYYVKDELGSVTELVNSTGSITSQFTYDPYGNRTTVSGTIVTDIGYAGYFYHAASALDFAMHRAYDPTHSRWLNRDPIGEAGGVNLYAYTDGNPVSNTDPSGLITSVDMACAMDPQFCLEIMGQIIGNNGAIIAKSTGDQCVAEEANRVANGFQLAATIATVAQLGGAAKGLVTGASNAVNAIRLEKQLASESQLAEVMSNQGRTMAGADMRRQIDDLARLLQEYGGKASDWVKVTSSAYRTRAGEILETHAYENLASGEVVEPKSILTVP
jgi:RHS repeat-associated protein